MLTSRRASIACGLAAFLASGPAAATAESRLVTAVKALDVDAARLLLRQKTVSINAIEPDGTTALHWAVHRNNRVLTEALIAAGANPNVANDYGATPLWLACSADGAVAGVLLAARADPGAALTSGETVLMRCAHTGNAAAVRQLLRHGADVNARGGLRSQTALMWAAAQRHPEVVKLLIEGGADIRARTAIRTQIVGMGLNSNNSAGGGPSGKSGMEFSVGGFTALLFAAQQGDVESTRILLAAGADINDKAADGASALVIAAHSGHTALATFLLEKGADPNRADAGYTALHTAVVRGDLALVKALLARGADPNVPMTKGTSVARYSDRWFLPAQFLGATPFFLSAQYAEIDIMRALAAAGADTVRATNSGVTPLMAAAGVGWHYRFDRRGRNLSIEVINAELEQESRSLEAVTLALELGSPIDAVNRSGETAAHGAASKKLRVVYDFLVSRGAKVDVKAKSGKTAADLIGSAQ
jgi:uncharacterized protein